MTRTALIIQEDIILLRILERLMMVNDYGCKAIRSLSDLNIEDQEVDFDVIISDILFDGIAPLDFVFQIKEIIPHKSLMIVTNMGQRKVQQEIMSSNNVTGFFAVPFDMDDIQKLLI
ncbi:response regulator [Salinimicrobium flavum]|uniref:Response regulator n=1 Tax=Salinimicrobium flavum TaxID=1737065 RepID=A0ABW5IT61_9FLAO